MRPEVVGVTVLRVLHFSASLAVVLRAPHAECSLPPAASAHLTPNSPWPGRVCGGQSHASLSLIFFEFSFVLMENLEFLPLLRE